MARLAAPGSARLSFPCRLGRQDHRERLATQRMSISKNRGAKNVQTQMRAQPGVKVPGET
eukprot:193056-Pyramimonas_sp.AAC.1